MSARYMLSPPRREYSLDEEWRLHDEPPRTWSLDDPVPDAVAEFVTRTTDLAELSVRAGGGGDLVVECLAVPWNRSTTINSREGNFCEKWARGSVPTRPDGKLLDGKLRMFWQHGDDALGHMPIGEVTELRDEPDGLWAKASLLAGVPPLIVSGLRRRMFGASVRFKPLVVDVVRRPPRSEANPAGIEERTVRSASLREISICNYPAYSSTSAALID